MIHFFREANGKFWGKKIALAWCLVSFKKWLKKNLMDTFPLLLQKCVPDIYSFFSLENQQVLKNVSVFWPIILISG